MDKEREDWLLSFDEMSAFSLPRSDWHDRIRLLRQRMGEEMLERYEMERRQGISEKTPPRASNAVVDYKEGWNKD